MLLNHKLILKMIHWVSMIERPNLKKGGTTIVLLSISAIKIDSLNPLSWLFGPYVKTRNKDTRIQVLHRCWWLVTTKMLQNSPDITCRFFQYQQNINKSLLSLCSISSAAMKQATQIKKISIFSWNKKFRLFLVGCFKWTPVWFCFGTIFSINQFIACCLLHLLVFQIKLISRFWTSVFRTGNILWSWNWAFWLSWSCCRWCIDICMLFSRLPSWWNLKKLE